MCFDRENNRQITEYPLYLHEDEKGNSEIIGRKGRKVRRLEMGGGMPEGGAPYQQLVTDGEGKTVWEDRLAYDGRRVYFEWNGATEGFETVTDPQGGVLVRVSDTVLTADDLVGTTLTVGAEKVTLEKDMLFQLTEDVVTLMGDMICVRKDGAEAVGMVFPKAGVYFSDRFTDGAKLEIGALKTIDPKYAPKITVYADDGMWAAYKDLDGTWFTKDEMLALGGNLNAVIVEVWDMTEGKFVEYCTPLAVGVFPDGESYAYMVIGRAHMNSDTHEMEFETKTIYTTERPS